MLDSAMVDYRKFKLNIDISIEEHISQCLIPILTVTVVILNAGRVWRPDDQVEPSDD